jgi:hypothetical protein
MAFAVFELKKIKSRKKKFDIKNQLVNNTFIFKENLKIITGSLIDTLWNEKVRTEKIQQTIQKAQLEINKGTFEEIIEMEEEEENYFSSEIVSKNGIINEAPKMQTVIEEDFMHSYDTDLESKEFKFGSREADPKKGAGEDQNQEIMEISEKKSNEVEGVIEMNSVDRKDAREFGTFGDRSKMPEVENKLKGVSRLKRKSRTDKNWRNDFENKNDDRESIDKEIREKGSKDLLVCQSMGNKWDLKLWEKQSNVEKPRTSASMGSLTLKSNQNGNSAEKDDNISNTLDNMKTKDKKSKWKPASGLNMYLLSRKNGSSQGSSMRSVSKSGSLRIENSNGAKSESLKRKRDNRGWVQIEQKKQNLSKRTLADRLSGQKHRNFKGPSSKTSNKMKKFPTYVPKRQQMSMTPDVMVQKKKNQRVSSLTKLKRLKNHLILDKKIMNENMELDVDVHKRGRIGNNRSPQQMVKRIISGFDKDTRARKKNSAKVYGILTEH